jgi:hypothetical protein
MNKNLYKNGFLLIFKIYLSLIYRMSEKSGTDGNFIYFSLFIYSLKLKVKRLKMALTLDKRV